MREGAGGGTGRAIAFCVRLCDGLHFPMEQMANATPLEICQTICPTSTTKVFFGNDIGSAVAKDGTRYADLGTAFVYRKQLVANCTCNGKNALGLASFDVKNDPTLRPGDVVSTKDGLMAFSGKRGQTGAFTAVDTSTRAALNAASSRQRSTPAVDEPIADDEPGTIMLPQNQPRQSVTCRRRPARSDRQVIGIIDSPTSPRRACYCGDGVG